MLRIRLREAMDVYRKRTGERLTYEKLALVSGLSISTLQSMAARPRYNTTLSTVEKLCIALDCGPGDLLELTKGDHGAVV
jgi:DNA-binding Xre family transcriptional regulator